MLFFKINLSVMLVVLIQGCRASLVRSPVKQITSPENKVTLQL